MNSKLHQLDRSIITNNYIFEEYSVKSGPFTRMDTYEDAIPIHERQLFNLPQEIHKPINYVYHDRIMSQDVNQMYLWESHNHSEVRMVLKSAKTQ